MSLAVMLRLTVLSTCGKPLADLFDTRCAIIFGEPFLVRLALVTGAFAETSSDGGWFFVFSEVSSTVYIIPLLSLIVKCFDDQFGQLGLMVDKLEQSIYNNNMTVSDIYGHKERGPYG